MELKKIKLKKLFSGLDVQIYGNKDLEISGISGHSKRVSFGQLFVAKGGLSSHGADFIEEAIIGGATAILCDLYNPFLKKVTQVICSSPASIEALLAKRFYDQEAKSLKVIGITGTNGKTTTAYLLRALLGEKKTGLIGTIEYVIGSKSYPATLTTPDVITNHKLLAQMKKAHLSYAVMEVTSHALTQGRVDQIDFEAAVFTNISQDHLDYHKTMENYIQAKSLLFQKLSSNKVAIINADDPNSETLTQKCRAKIKTYGLFKEATYRAQNIIYTPKGTSFDLLYQKKKTSLKTPLIGQFNVYNTLAALAVALEQGYSLSSLAKVLKNLKAPHGRLEPITHSLGFQVFVDFAHTPDALENTLSTLEQIPHKRILTVFGCGGDRDQEKRALMGRVASLKSDLVFITSDNPRSEDPDQICRSILKGCLYPEKTFVLVDRREAIEKALTLATQEDLVLIAGRGHELYQILGRSRLPFSDVEVVKEILKDLEKKTLHI